MRARTKPASWTTIARGVVAGIVLASVIAPAATAKGDASDPAGHRWVEIRSTHFRVFSDASERRAREVAIELERFRAALDRFTSGLELDDSVPTVLFAFRNGSRFEPYRLDEDGAPMNIVGYFLPTAFKNFIALDASGTAGSMRVVYHEYFHQVMNATIGDLPLWLGEGLAEYYSTFVTRGSSKHVELGHAIDEHLRYMNRVNRIPWSEVFETTPASPAYNESERQGAFYAQSWLLIHYLTSFDDGIRGLGKYLMALRAGADPDEAFEPSFGMTRQALTAGADEHRKGSRFLYRSWEEDDLEALESLEVRSVQAADVLYELGDLLAHRGQTEAAIRHLRRAREAGRPQGDVEASLGYLALANEDLAEARTRMRAAIDAGVRLAEPYVLLAQIELDEILGADKTGPDDAPAGIENVRALLETGLELAPDSFEVAMILARTYLVGPDPGRGLAVILGARARRPLDIDAAMVHACLLARSGGAGPAWAIARDEIAPRDPATARRASQCVVYELVAACERSLERGDREGASAMLGTALEQIDDPAHVADLRGLKEAIDSGSFVRFGADGSSEDRDARNAALERYNLAVKKSNEGDVEGALAIVEELAQTSPDPQIRGEAAKAVDMLRKIVERDRWVASYDAAIRLAEDGKIAEAVAALRALQATAPDEASRAALDKLLGQIDGGK